MNLKGSCNYLYEDGRRCSKTFILHEFYFRDPFHASNCFSLDLCKWHTDEITGNIIAKVKDYQMKLTNTISERARLRKIARENDTYYNSISIEQKIDDLKRLIKKISINECKNYFCNNNLLHLEKESKIFSVNVFKPSGRRWYTFYYCSLNCFNNMKAKCGILPLTLTGQRTF